MPRPAPDERMENIGVTPPDERDDEEETSPDPDQPARGNDPDSGDGSGSGGTGDVNETEPDPEPEPDQPARGRDPDSGDGRGSGGTGDVGESEPEDDPTDQPARGNDPSSGDGRGSGGNGSSGGGGGGEGTEELEPRPEPEPEPTVVNPWEVAEGDVAPGQGIEARDAPEPLASTEIDERGIVQSDFSQAYYDATGEQLNEPSDLDKVDFRRVNDKLYAFEAGEAQAGATAIAAEQLEQQVADESGLTPDDVAVQKRDGQLTAIPTEKYATEQVAEEYRSRENIPDDAVSIQDGNVQIDTGQVQQETTNLQNARASQARAEAVQKLETNLEKEVGQQRAEALGATSRTVGQPVEETTDLERGEDYVVKVEDGTITGELTDQYRQDLQETAAETQLEDTYGVDLDKQDFEVNESGGVELTESGQRTIEREATQAPIDYGPAEGVKESIEEGVVLPGLGKVGEPNLPEQRQDRFETEEPLPGEQTARNVGQRLTKGGQQAGEALFAKGGFAARSGGGAILAQLGYEDAAQQYESSLRQVGQGITGGVGGLASQAVTIPYEAAEVASNVPEEGVAETAQDFGASAVEAGAAAASEAASRPAFFAGAIGGSVALSGGLFRATRDTPVVGRASRVALQPGEEAAKVAASRGIVPTSVATKVPGVRAGQMGLKAETETETTTRIKSAKSEIQKLAADERGQSSLIGKTEAETESEFEFDLDTIELEDKKRISDIESEKRLEQEKELRRLREERNRIKRGEEERIKPEGTAEDYVSPNRGSDYISESRGGDFVASDRPRFGQSGPRGSQTQTYRADIETESEAESRIEQAQEQEVGVDEDLNVGVASRAQMRSGALGAILGAAAMGKTKARAEADTRSLLEVAQEPRTRTKVTSEIESLLESAQEPSITGETARETALETEATTEAAIESEAAVEAGVETEAAVEAEVGVETEVEAEVDTEAEVDAEPEMPGMGQEKGRRQFDFSSSAEPEDTGQSDQLLTPGYLEETATVLGAGRPDEISPSQEQLESEDVRDVAGGTLPTAQMFGDEETKEQVEAAQSFLSFGVVGDSGDDEPEGLL